MNEGGGGATKRASSFIYIGGEEKSVEELNAQLVSLVGENGAEMSISAFRSRRSISGPELAG